MIKRANCVRRSNSVSGAGEVCGNIAKRCGWPRCDDQRLRCPLTMDVPRNTRLQASASCGGAAVSSLASFSAGRDSPEGSLLHMEVTGAQQAGIGRHPVASREPNDVTLGPARAVGCRANAPPDSGCGCDFLAQTGRGLLRARGLDDVQYHTTEHDEGNDRGVDHIVEEARDEARQEHQHQWIGRKREQRPQTMAMAVHNRFVGPCFQRPPVCLVLCQTAFRGVQLCWRAACGEYGDVA